MGIVVFSSSRDPRSKEMRRYPLWVLLLSSLILVESVYGGEAIKAGMVKGTITMGGKPASDAVVSVEGLPQESLRPQLSNDKFKRAFMDQRDIKFIPRVLPVLVGTRVDFRNNDKTFHNVFSTSEAKKFDIGLQPPGKTRSVAFDKPGVVRILCNVHPDMEGFIVVKGHPYFSAADKQGSYQINAVPVGKYRLDIWHPDFGTQVLPFELVREGEVLAIDVDLKKK
jgi:plastocyanin